MMDISGPGTPDIFNTTVLSPYRKTVQLRRFRIYFEENRSSTIAILEHGDSCLWEHLYKFICWPFLLWNGFKTFPFLSFSNQSINLTLSLICSPTNFWKNVNLELFIIDYASWSKMETRNRKLAEDIESQLHKTHHEKRNVRFER